MTVRIDYEPIIRDRGRSWHHRWYWRAYAHRGGTYLDHAYGHCFTRLGATIARDRAADRLRRTHGGGV